MSTNVMLDWLDPLGRALIVRGFEMFVAVRVACSDSNMDRVAREVSALTGVDLEEAEDVVRQGQIILSALATDQAERVRKRLAAAGGHTTLVLTRANLYAFLPSHRERSSQVCERLAVIGRKLELAKGQLGAWAEARMQALPVDDGDLGDLITAIDRQRATWAAAGWREAGGEMEVLQRVSARNEQLEARICAAEGDVIGLETAVYGDWLQAQGDARGDVGSAALCLDAARDDVDRASASSQLAELLTRNVRHLFGPVYPLLERGRMKIEWMGPMIRTVRLSGTMGDIVEHASLFGGLLALPACAGLRELVLEHYFFMDVDLVQVLARASCASSLRRLSVSDATRLVLEDVRFERLEQLELDLMDLQCRELHLPALRRLALSLSNPSNWLATAVDGLDAPRLEHFEFTAQVPDHRAQYRSPFYRQLAGMLKLPLFARLRSLTLRSLPGSVPYSAGLARVLSSIPMTPKLEFIDLRGAPLELEARAEFEAMQASLPKLLLP